MKEKFPIMGTKPIFDFVILGGGAAAFGAAIKANELKVKTALINEGLPLGGTCVNVGCVPSKAMLYPGEILHLFSHHGIKGLPTLDPSIHGNKISFQDLIQEELEIVSKARQEKYEKVLNELNFVTFFEGKAKFVSSHEIEVKGEVIQGEKFLIATGSKTSVPPIPGLLESGYLTHIEALKLFQQPESLVILGAGPVGLEFAQMFSRLGTKVTIISRRERILPNLEPELALELERIFENEGIELLHKTQITEAAKVRGNKKLILETEGKRKELLCSEILLATGKKPNTRDLQLEKVGVKIEPNGAVITQPTLETSVPHIFAAGDVTNLPVRLETTAGKEGTLAALNALTGTEKTINYQSVPSTIFTDPPFSWVGLTDEQAAQKGYPCSCRTLSFDKIPKAQILRKSGGKIKMVIHRKTHEILGVHVLALSSPEFIAAAALAIQKKMTVEELTDLLFVFPTSSEALKTAALSFLTDISKLSCCV
jgi:mercuric reductase